MSAFHYLLLSICYEVFYLLNFSLNWQHQLCKNPRPNPDIKTLFTDHTCASTNGARPPPPSNTPLAGPVPKPGAFPPLGVHSVRKHHSFIIDLLLVCMLRQSYSISLNWGFELFHCSLSSQLFLLLQVPLLDGWQVQVLLYLMLQLPQALQELCRPLVPVSCLNA